jgi:hypothetical protein
MPWLASPVVLARLLGNDQRETIPTPTERSLCAALWFSLVSINHDPIMKQSTCQYLNFTLRKIKVILGALRPEMAKRLPCPTFARRRQQGDSKYLRLAE